MMFSFLVEFYGEVFLLYTFLFLENNIMSPRFLINSLLQSLEKSLNIFQDYMNNFTKK